MSNAAVWKTWEGRVVEGKYPLRQWLGGSEHSAVFLTELQGLPSSKAAIKLIAADGPEADRQLARWRVAAQLSHPHLIRIFDAGRCRIDNTPLVYVAMESAEEDLSQILPQRPLVPGEASDMLPPLLAALSYVHGKGFVHGRIKPSNVLAAGNQLKLSADQIVPAKESTTSLKRRDAYDAPERAAGIISPEGDIWSVGVTLVAALTQNTSFANESASADPTVPGTIPEPFRGIARECVHLDPKRRCSIADIQARLQPAARSVPAVAPVLLQTHSSAKRGRWAAALLAIAVLLALFVFFYRGKGGNEPTTEQTAPQSSPQTAAPPAPATAPAPKPGAAVREPSSRRHAAASQGAVTHQVIPEVSRNSRNTITGTIRVTVRVELDSSGKVRSARLTTAGPSKYFAGLALNAAQRWEFSPQSASRTWLIQFRFRRSGTEASAEPA